MPLELASFACCLLSNEVFLRCSESLIRCMDCVTVYLYVAFIVRGMPQSGLPLQEVAKHLGSRFDAHMYDRHGDLPADKHCRRF